MDGDTGGIGALIRGHAGWAELEAFGARLRSAPLSHAQLCTFFASAAVFFREIPGGILALALRMTDARMGTDRFGAVRAGAHVLLAAVDEFGLGAGPQGARTHHELFLATALRLGICEQDLRDPAYLLPEAEELAGVTRHGYRHAPLAESAGFHYASEITSDREFLLCYEGLSAHAADYGIGGARREDALAFFYVHTLVEPAHGASGAAALEIAAPDVDGRAAAAAGAARFMRAYEAFWAGLNRTYGRV